MRDISAPNFRIFTVNRSGNLTLQNTTVSGGDNSVFNGGGGGVLNLGGGTVTLTNSTVSGNSAGLGGGVFNLSTMTLTNSTVSGNYSNNIDGGVFNQGAMTLTNSTVSGNSANFSGGGVDNQGTMTLTNSTVSGNSAGYNFGGVYNFGTMTLTNSTISENSATNIGGVINQGTMTLTNSTVSGNSAANYGGVYSRFRLTLSHTLISGNTGGTSPEVYNNSTFGTLYANDFNLFGHDGNSGTNFTPGATDIVPSAALSAILNTTLANNGGPTQTLALVSGSPAIDKIPAANCPPPSTDQRGFGRPVNGKCDIGSFEFGAFGDSDNDGVPDNQDQCSNSNLSPTVIIDGCNSGVANTLSVLGKTGCTISDLVGQCAVGATNHRKFVSCVSGLTNSLKNAGVITGSQKNSIQSCARGARIP